MWRAGWACLGLYASAEGLFCSRHCSSSSGLCLVWTRRVGYEFWAVETRQLLQRNPLVQVLVEVADQLKPIKGFQISSWALIILICLICLV